MKNGQPEIPAFETLTDETMLALLYTARIIREGGPKYPSLSACKRLAATVEMLRLESSESWRQAAADRELLKKNLNETQLLAARLKEQLQDSLVRFKAELRTEPRHSVAEVIDTIVNDSAALDQLLEATKKVSSCRSLAPLEPMVAPAEKWHDYAEALADAFRKAMRSTNKVELKYRGPVARFVVAMIRRVTGEKVTEVAVAGYLRRTAPAETAK
jgi:hypothetical protein